MGGGLGDSEVEELLFFTDKIGVEDTCVVTELESGSHEKLTIFKVCEGDVGTRGLTCAGTSFI